MPVLNSLTFTLADQVWETTQTTGTGSYVLDGAKVNLGITYRTFLSALGNGVRTGYTITQGTNKEVALGTVSSPNTLSRDSILFSTNSNNAVSWSAGVKDIQCDISAALANQIWARPGGSLLSGAIDTRGPFTLSGTEQAVLSILTGVKQISIAVANVRRNGTQALVVELGDSGGYETTGYSTAVAGIHASTLVDLFSVSTAMVLSEGGGSPTMEWSGSAIITPISSSMFSYQSVISSSWTTPVMNYASGMKGLSSTLDRLRIHAGGNTFTQGTVTVHLHYGVT